MHVLACIVIGYIIGTVNPSYIFSRIKGFDIRSKGSGNAGASNAVIVFGKAVGIFCAIFDIMKAYFAIWIVKSLFPTFALAFALTGAACILGHIFPFYMKFRGGKGLACLGGTILVFDWRVFLIMLAAELVIVLLTKYICFVPMTASFIFTLIYGLMKHDVIGSLIFLLVSVVILIKHIENIKRIRLGVEARISMLWNKEKEIERVKRNIEKLS